METKTAFPPVTGLEVTDLEVSEQAIRDAWDKEDWQLFAFLRKAAGRPVFFTLIGGKRVPD